MTSGAPLLRASGLTRTYARNDRRFTVLNAAEFSVMPGEIVAVVGRSGSGKTTLLNLLGGLDRPDAGEVEIDGRSLARMSDAELAQFRNETIGFVFQGFLLRPVRTALDNVIVPLLLDGKTVRDARSAGRAALESVGLAGMSSSPVSSLSGGQRQRVAIARAIANNPRLLLADEPTGNLDADTAREIYELLLSLRGSRGTTVICVTHDPLAGEFGIPMVTIQDGKIIECGLRP